MLKEMVYQSSPVATGEILCQGTYENHKFAIVSFGTHPSAYVSTNLNINSCQDKLLDDVEVHMDFTSYGRYGWNNDEEWYLGWDYGHVCDWIGCFSEEENNKYHRKKWTTEEILEEVKSVITQLNKIKDQIEQRTDKEFERLGYEVTSYPFGERAFYKNEIYGDDIQFDFENQRINCLGVDPMLSFDTIKAIQMRLNERKEN